jgi:Rrf2 family transcriptional regulator, iron-sulfur cluster assembly transcription factor
MKLNLTTKHAIRSLLYLGGQPEELCSVRKIHEVTGIPQKYLGHVMRRLCEAEMVTASRGKKGGYRLAKDPGQISIARVLAAVEGLEAFDECMLGLDSCNSATRGFCPLHEPWQIHRHGILETLEKVSLADLAGTAPCVWELPK